MSLRYELSEEVHKVQGTLDSPSASGVASQRHSHTESRRTDPAVVLELHAGDCSVTCLSEGTSTAMWKVHVVVNEARTQDVLVVEPSLMLGSCQ